jgi:hypothetical protein
VHFTSPASADLFAQECTESLLGLIRRNFCNRFDTPNVGFLHASIDGRAWENTMWPRDAAVVLREFIHWGRLDEACLLAISLMQLVQPNEEGYYCYPEYFRIGEPASGTEVDGTTGVIIALCLLWHRLPQDAPERRRIYTFLTNKQSPVQWIADVLDKQSLVPGSGEFGGGCDVPGLHCNVVQNAMCRLALLAAAGVLNAGGDAARAQAMADKANRLEKSITEKFTAADGTWMWCVDSETFQPNQAILDHPMNKGFGGINGVLSMQTDVLGLDPGDTRWFGVDPSRATLERLLDTPLRREQFDKYGIWTQFDEPPIEYLMSPSYGQGYATQAMLLLDQFDRAAHSLHFLAEYTFSPARKLRIDRESPYWFFERYVSPDNTAPKTWDQGCGALNAVCVAEPLKIARLIIGLDDSRPEHTRLIPRLPEGWTGYSVENWPALTNNGLVWLDLDCERDGDAFCFECYVRDGAKLPAVELVYGGQRETWHDVDGFEAEWPV